MPVVEPVHQLAGVTLVSELADDLLESLRLVLVNPQQGVRGRPLARRPLARRPLARLLMENHGLSERVHGQDDGTVF